NITRTARWDIAHHGNIYAGNYRNRKREKASGYMGSNPPGSFTYLSQVHKIHFHWILSLVWMQCWFNPVNVGSKSGSVGSVF
ncbi:hypothetical protein ACU63M_07100, partial [Klebsiella aerogenes]